MTSTADSIERRRRRSGMHAGLRFAGAALAINALMALFKVILGVLTGSHALLASALYSVNDVLSAIAVAVSLRIGIRRPDDRHPYGYGKAEFVAVAIVSLAIAIGVFLMFSFSIVDIARGVSGPPHFTAMVLAAASMVVSWSLARKGSLLAKKLQSPALNTSAEHHHADALGGLVTLAGVGGAVLGFHVLDRLAAVFETLHLITLSGALLARALKGLMDVAIPEEEVQLLRGVCGKVEGVRRVQRIWSRRVGSETCVDMAVVVDPQLTVREAQDITVAVQVAVRRVLGPSSVTQVMVHGYRYLEVLPRAGGNRGPG